MTERVSVLDSEPTEREAAYFSRLEIPTHPDYDFDKDPADQFEYANPVTLNNQLVLYTNAAIGLTQTVVSLGRRRQASRLRKKDLERKLKGLRNRVLSDNPAPPSAAKNLALTEAYVFRCLDAAGKLNEAEQLEAQIAVLEDEGETMKEEVENLHFTMKTLELAGTNVMTHLSWLKAEVRNHGRTSTP